MTKKRILIVDDSRTVREQIVACLVHEYECLTAASGKEGYALALKELPAVVISDLEMPEMDGVELLKALKAEATTKAIPVVIVTTSTAVDKMNQCRSLGCASFVLKPVEGEYLRVKMRQLVAKLG